MFDGRLRSVIAVTFDELKGDIDRYLDESLGGDDIVIMEDGVEIGVFRPSMYALRDRLIKKFDEGYSVQNHARIGVAKGKFELPANFDEMFDELDARSDS